MIAALIVATLGLRDVQAAALARAPAVARARAAVSERQALLRAAGTGGAPHAFVNYVQVPQGGAAGTTIVQHLTTAGAQITLGDIVGRSAAVAQAQAELRVAQQNERSAERTERLSVIDLYFAAIRTRRIAVLRDQMLATAKADLRAAGLRYSAGDAPRLDVLRADVAYAQALAESARAHADADNAAHALALEIGRPDSSLELPNLTDVQPDVHLPPSREDAVAIALQRRPDVAAARIAVRVEEAALQAARRAVFPALTAQAGWAQGVDSGFHVAGPSVNVTLDIPISHDASDRVAAQQARVDEARATLALQVQNVDDEVSSALRTYRADVEAARAAAGARSEAQNEVRATREGYRAGALSGLDLEDARRTYAQAAVDDTTAAAALLQARAQLDITMGTEP